MAKSRSPKGNAGNSQRPGANPGASPSSADADRTLLGPGSPAAGPGDSAPDISVVPPHAGASAHGGDAKGGDGKTGDGNDGKSDATTAAIAAGKAQAAELKGRRARKATPARDANDPLEILKSVLWAVVLFFVIRTFLVTAYSIPSESMEDSLLVGDYLMANNALFGATLPFTNVKLPALRDPRRGEIVVFRPTYNEPQIDVVKRVVGVPGDTLQMRDQVLYRNGRRVAESYASYKQGGDEPIAEFGQGLLDPTIDPARYGSHNHFDLLVPSVDKRAYQPTRNNWGPLVIPAGHYWLMGDNRDQSLDSRFMGPIPREVIRGKPLFIYFSWDKMNPSAPFPRPITAARWDRFFNPVR